MARPLDPLLRQIARWVERLLRHKSTYTPLILERKETALVSLIQFERKTARAIRTWRANFKYEARIDARHHFPARNRSQEQYLRTWLERDNALLVLVHSLGDCPLTA